MTWFFITIPLMIVAVAIATIPVLYHSVREHRLLQEGTLPTCRAVPRSAEYWTRPARARTVATGREHSTAA
ncbi:MAG TPA: hypothetical protein VMV06_07375 [Acidimicrobiales bacterium]|nr:hypothetical protein [Acidimicrobiales bacterium]